MVSLNRDADAPANIHDGDEVPADSPDSSPEESPETPVKGSGETPAPGNQSGRSGQKK